MRRVEFAVLTLSIIFGMGLAEANTQTINSCNKIAETCRQTSGSKVINHECTRKYDACMNKAHCDDVYLSCLELREEDPAVAEHICSAERNKCAMATSRD